jgi:acetyltransferase-like isoleucine patch superfamily enzyme
MIFDNFKKKFYQHRCQKVAKSYGSGFKVNGESYVTPNTSLGNNVNFNGMKIQGNGSVIIGDNFHSGIECMIITSIHNYDEGNSIPYDDTIISKDVIIEDNVWLGNRVTILPGVTIGEGAIIQAGSVVVNDIEKYAIAGGHPAKTFKYRNIEHYEKLKEEKKFH